MLYFLTAVPVFELEEIFLELHTCFLVSSYLVNPRHSSFVSERLPRENWDEWSAKVASKCKRYKNFLKQNNVTLKSQNFFAEVLVEMCNFNFRLWALWR